MEARNTDLSASRATAGRNGHRHHRRDDAAKWARAVAEQLRTAQTALDSARADGHRQTEELTHRATAAEQHLADAQQRYQALVAALAAGGLTPLRRTVRGAAGRASTSILMSEPRRLTCTARWTWPRPGVTEWRARTNQSDRAARTGTALIRTLSRCRPMSAQGG